MNNKYSLRCWVYVTFVEYIYRLNMQYADIIILKIEYLSALNINIFFRAIKESTYVLIKDNSYGFL